MIKITIRENKQLKEIDQPDELKNQVPEIMKTIQTALMRLTEYYRASEITRTRLYEVGLLSYSLVVRKRLP